MRYSAISRIKVSLHWLSTFFLSLWGPMVITLILGLPRLRFPLGEDPAVYSNAAQVILDGGRLYRDIWLNYPPTNALLYAALGSIWGLSAATPQLLHLLESLAGVALVYAAGQLALGRKEGLLGSYIFGLASMFFVVFNIAAEAAFLTSCFVVFASGKRQRSRRLTGTL